MKKQIIIFMVMLAVVLSACGTQKAKVDEPVGTESSVNDLNSTTAEEGATKEDSIETVQKEQTDTSAETTASNNEENITLLQLNKDCKSVVYMDLIEYEHYLDYIDEKVVLSKEDAATFPALAATLEKELTDRNNTFQAGLDSLIEKYKEKEAAGNSTGFKVQHKKSIQRADSVVLSVLDLASDYTGGDYGIYDVYGYNYDTQTGQILKFSDVVSKPVEFLKLADDKIQKSFNSDFETPSTLDEFYGTYDNSIIWTMDYQGVKIYFNTNTLGSYALGMIETEIYYNEAPELFDSRFLNIPESYVMDIRRDEISSIDIDNDGEGENISLTDSGIIIDGKRFSFDGNPERYFFVSNKGKNYIFVTVSDEIGFYTISSIDLTSMEIDSANDTEGFLASEQISWSDEDERSEYNYIETVFTDPDKVLLSTYIYYLGTMTGLDYFHMEDGRFVANTGIYNIDMDSVLTANMDIECEQVDLEGNVVGKAVIPEGTRMVIRRGDGNTFADLIEVPSDAVVEEYEYYIYLASDLRMEDADIIYRVRGELDEYGSRAIINGEAEYMVFNNIMYSD